MCRSFYSLVRYEIHIASQDVIIASQIAMWYRLLATLANIIFLRATANTL